MILPDPIKDLYNVMAHSIIFAFESGPSYSTTIILRLHFLQKIAATTLQSLLSLLRL